jgi:hypothetical protein
MLDEPHSYPLLKALQMPLQRGWLGVRACQNVVDNRKLLPLPGIEPDLPACSTLLLARPIYDDTWRWKNSRSSLYGLRYIYNI